MKTAPKHARVVDFGRELTASGLTQGQFARLTGTTPTTVSRWMTGKHKVPKWALAYLTLYAAIRDALPRV